MPFMPRTLQSQSQTEYPHLGIRKYINRVASFFQCFFLLSYSCSLVKNIYIFLLLALLSFQRNVCIKPDLFGINWTRTFQSHTQAKEKDRKKHKHIKLTRNKKKWTRERERESEKKRFGGFSAVYFQTSRTQHHIININNDVTFLLADCIIIQWTEIIFRRQNGFLFCLLIFVYMKLTECAMNLINATVSSSENSVKIYTIFQSFVMITTHQMYSIGLSIKIYTLVASARKQSQKCWIEKQNQTHKPKKPMRDECWWGRERKCKRIVQYV